MGYVGRTPAVAALTSEDITDGTITNLDVNSNAAISLSKTALTAGTGLTLATNDLSVNASQTQITSVGSLNVGSITSGFGTINNGANSITTTGTLAAGTLTVTTLVASTSAGSGASPSTSAGLHVTASSAPQIAIRNTSEYANTEIWRIINNDAAGLLSFDTVNDAYSSATQVFGISRSNGVGVASGGKMWLDGVAGGGDTYIYEESADDLHVVVGGVSMAQFDQDGAGDGIPTISLGDTATVANNALTLGGTINRSAGGAATATTGLAVTHTIAGPENNASAPGRSIYGIHAKLGTMTGISGAANNVFADIAITPATTSTPGGGNVAIRTGLYIDAAPAGGTQNYALHIASGAVAVAGSAGTDGQVLTSGGANANAAWEDASGGVTIATTAPSSPVAGDMWFNSATSTVSGIYSKAIASYSGTAWEQMTNKGFSATGGTESTYSSGGVNYKVHTFTTSGTFTPDSAGDVDVLVVAGGGGGGGGRHTGAGGAGGAIYTPSKSVTAQGYSIIIGGGGANGVTSGSSGGAHGVQGGPSSGLDISTVGGGLGAGHSAGASGAPYENGGNGGSGGASAHTSRVGGSGTSGQGYGGSGGLNRSAIGGGGGAGGAGSTGSGNEGASSGAGGNGGVGIQVDIDGNNHYWAGGGGGSASPSNLGAWVGGSGGIGGGGGGASSSNGGTAGTGGGSARNAGANGIRTQTTGSCHGGNGGTNTGGGGGGAAGWGSTGNGNGGAGGSGIVIIRYVV